MIHASESDLNCKLDLGMIPQTIIDQILSQTDIVSVISQHVTLKKSGANFKGCCPFHNEKTPSFVVSPHKQIYHCFGCGVGGNAIGFLMALERLEFPAAVERLAEPLNIKIPKTGKAPSQDESLTDKLYKINAYAQWFFEEQLRQSPQTLKYIESRGINETTLKTFKLGYAPDSFEKLVDFLKSKNIPIDLADKLGLVRKRDRSGHYDFYRHRLMFPIHNTKGQIIGFGGRALAKDDSAKYINSPESPIYNKSRELYGLDLAKKSITKSDKVLIVEGYVDVLACHQLGLEIAVAPLGTSLTDQQIKILKRYTQNFHLMFDGDNAGKKAALRSLELCLKQGVHPRIIMMNEGLDPGSYMENPALGADSLLTLVDNSPLGLDWLLASIIQQAAGNPQDKSKLLNLLIKYLDVLSDRIERYEYLKRASQFFEIPISQLEKNLEFTNDSDNFTRLNEYNLGAEESLVYGLFHSPEKFANVNLDEICEQMSDAQVRDIARYAINFFKKHETLNLSRAIDEMPESLQGLMRKILLSGDEHKLVFDATECLGKIKRTYTKKRLKQITAQIYQAETSRNTELKAKLLKEKLNLLKQ